MKRGSKGIPDNLKPLAKKGERVRFNGFWLNESKRDRVIAGWLDETPQGAATVIKELLYRYITGAGSVQILDTGRDGDVQDEGESARILGSFED